MSYAAGIGWSLAAAVAHSAIDVLRKLGSQRIPPADLVALAALYDAVFATLGVLYASGGSLPDFNSFPEKNLFFFLVFVTATLAAFARLLYQRALSIAPLSLTVPYLAFTPAFVVMVSPLFLAGEVPAPMGMLGVFIVSISGYLLGRITAPCSQQHPTSPSKLKLPTMAASSSMRTSYSGGAPKQQQLQHQHQITLQQQPLPQAQLHAVDDRALHHTHHDQWREHQHLRSSAVVNGDSEQGGMGSGRSSQSSIWAISYYKLKAPNASPAKGLPVAPLQLLASAVPALGPSNSKGIAAVDNLESTSGCGSQAKELKDKPTRPAAVRVPRKLQEAAQRGRRQLLVRIAAAITSPKAAPAMVLTAALLYSITASADKLGIAAAEYSLSAYFLAQRLLIGGVAVVYLSLFSRGALRHIAKDSVLLVSISLVELGSVVFYLLAIENILVSYVVAIKRVNVLLSTLIGCMLFKEQVGKRIPYIMVMLIGMLLIVLQPGHEDHNHSHHTRLHLL